MASAFMASKSCCARALRVGEAQLLRQIEHMFRARIAVQLARQSEPHAAAFSQVSELVVGKSLERSCLHAGIRLQVLGERCAGGKDQRGGEGDGCAWHCNDLQVIFPTVPARHSRADEVEKQARPERASHFAVMHGVSPAH
jgi:hypothetical protein